MGKPGCVPRRLFPLALVASLCLAAVAVHAQDPVGVEAAFGNTIVSTYANGDTARLWLDRDGSYRGMGRRGDPSRGRWMEKDDKLCLRQLRPLPMPLAFCTPIIQQGVGAMWSATSVFGEPLIVALVAGR